MVYASPLIQSSDILQLNLLCATKPFMQQPDNDIPPPIRPEVTGVLRRLKPGQSWLFMNLNPASVQAIVTRVAKEFSGKRKFTTAKQPDGNLRVWRLQ
jgi:hypothetical protein